VDSDRLNVEVGRAECIAAGSILGLLGALLAVLPVLLLMQIPSGGAKQGMFLFVGAVISGAIAWFCLSLSWRFIMNRPNRYGSIIGPVAWRISAAFWGVAAIAIAVGFIITRDLQLVWPLLGGSALSFGSWKRGAAIRGSL
jgi:hypothetical protein